MSWELLVVKMFSWVFGLVVLILIMVFFRVFRL